MIHPRFHPRSPYVQVWKLLVKHFRKYCINSNSDKKNTLSESRCHPHCMTLWHKYLQKNQWFFHYFSQIIKFHDLSMIFPYHFILQMLKDIKMSSKENLAEIWAQLTVFNCIFNKQTDKRSSKKHISVFTNSVHVWPYMKLKKGRYAKMFLLCYLLLGRYRFIIIFLNYNVLLNVM